MYYVYYAVAAATIFRCIKNVHLGLHMFEPLGTYTGISTALSVTRPLKPSRNLYNDCHGVAMSDVPGSIKGRVDVKTTLYRSHGHGRLKVVCKNINI